MNCSHCKDTGDSGSGYLDCIHCDAASTIANQVLVNDAISSLERIGATSQADAVRALMLRTVELNQKGDYS